VVKTEGLGDGRRGGRVGGVSKSERDLTKLSVVFVLCSSWTRSSNEVRSGKVVT
jgi:hypothetical protein